MAVCPLEHYPRPVHLQLLHADERQPLQLPPLHQQPILKLPAHGHNLLEKLHDAEAVEFILGKRARLRQLLRLPLLIEDSFPRGDFVLRHLPADIHALLEKRHDLRVYAIYLFPQLHQIHVDDSFIFNLFSILYQNNLDSKQKGV